MHPALLGLPHFDAVELVLPCRAGASEAVVEDLALAHPDREDAPAGDAADGLLNGLSIESLQRWTLVYLGLSALAFIVVWLVGYLRRPG